MSFAVIPVWISHYSKRFYFSVYMFNGETCVVIGNKLLYGEVGLFDSGNTIQLEPNSQAVLQSTPQPLSGQQHLLSEKDFL